MEDERYYFHHGNTREGPTNCDCKGKSVARLGAKMKIAAPTGASIFRAGDMMTARSDSKTSRHYLAGLPQNAVAGVWLQGQSMQKV
jgi:hypothetical protein